MEQSDSVAVSLANANPQALGSITKSSTKTTVKVGGYYDIVGYENKIVECKIEKISRDDDRNVSVYVSIPGPNFHSSRIVKAFAGPAFSLMLLAGGEKEVEL